MFTLKHNHLQYAVIAFLTGFYLSPALAQHTNFSVFLGQWLEIHEKIQTTYIEKNISEQTLIQGAIQGLLASLADPYTRYLTPDEFQELQEEKSGHFEGLGLQVDLKDGQWVVIAPLEDTLAWQTGIQSGDIIIEINGFATTGMSLGEIKEKLSGKSGDKVSITIFRPGDHQNLNFELVVTTIEPSVVKYEVKQKYIGYLRISSFLNEQVAEKVKIALINLKKQKIKALVIDIRNNPGGLLSNILSIGDYLMEGGIIVRIVDREGNESLQKASSQVLVDTQIPIALLIDKGSASASEVLAGALKDHHRATLIGEPTFGKGLVQTIHNLSDGSGLILTTHKYLTAAGADINHKGISPNIEVVSDPRSPQDLQLQSALTYLETSQLGHQSQTHSHF